jgi:hypothetical protein
MLYKWIDVELIVIDDEAEAVVAELEAALDRLEEKHTLFGGGVTAVPFEHLGVRRLSRRKQETLGTCVALAGRSTTRRLYRQVDSLRWSLSALAEIMHSQRNSLPS